MAPNSKHDLQEILTIVETRSVKSSLSLAVVGLFTRVGDRFQPGARKERKAE